MEQTMTLPNAPDLRKSFPRSPNEKIGPYIFLARIIDKCRATINGTNGEYNYNCPLDRRFFDFTGVDADAFKEQVAQGKSDEEMAAWVQANSRPLTQEEISAWIYKSRTAKPETPEYMAYYEQLRQDAAPNHYYIETWFQLLDAEEGRIPPNR